MERSGRIFVAGHNGLVGSAVVRKLKAEGFNNLLLRSRAELDLLRQERVEQFFAESNIDYVFVCAAKVGGISYNQRFPADFLYENIQIAANIVHSAAQCGVKKLLYLGSSCIYPKHASQPITEDSLLSGALEATNEGYAIAKIAGLKLCEKYSSQYGKNFISVMPTNLYGPNDDFHPENSHVIPGMMRRFHEATKDNLPEVVIWGTGTARREFLYVDDLAEGLFVLMQKYNEPWIINIGTGEDCTIRELAELMKTITGYEGVIRMDSTRPDGTPRKLLDVTRLRAMGWKPRYCLQEGLEKAYRWAVEHGQLE